MNYKYFFKCIKINPKIGIYILILFYVLCLSFLLPNTAFTQSVENLEFYFREDDINVKVKLDNTLPEKSPEISGERIRYIDKGKEVTLTFKINLYKRGWWVFNDQIRIEGKNEIVIERTIKKDIVKKIYTIKETSNLSSIEGLDEEYEFVGTRLDNIVYKREKFKKLRALFFEKEINIKINYENIKFARNGRYFMTCKAEYHSYNPIFGTGEPGNFFTRTAESEIKKFTKNSTMRVKKEKNNNAFKTVEKIGMRIETLYKSEMTILIKGFYKEFRTTLEKIKLFKEEIKVTKEKIEKDIKPTINNDKEKKIDSSEKEK